jgi:VIT1/CCC1 family predicted Fe2+/Mn2+ transporter
MDGDVGSRPLTPLMIGRDSAALFLLGLGVSRLTDRPPVPAGIRQLALGGVAALVTYLIGQAIGTAL